MITYLLCPALPPLNGRGHLMRMIRLQKQLAHSRIYIPADISPDAWSDTFRNVSADADCLIVNDPGEPKLIVLDMPWIDDADLEDFQRRAPVLALDLGGSGRFRASFLIDTLPYPGGRAHSRHFPP
ncbi:MAG: hypothetical protein ACR2PY_01970, partial [Salinispira sp.]